MISKTNIAITIGMPVYNGAKYIGEALDSLLVQTFTDFELIISDNASTDATQSICEEYARRDLRIRYVRQSENRGALANFQFVLDQAQGEFFMWAAADDKWDRDWVRSLRNALETAGVGAAFGKLMHIDENSKTLKHPANGNTFKYVGSKLRRRIRYFIEFERYGKANPIYSLFRRSALRGLVITAYSVDFHIVFDVLLKTEIIPVKDTVLYKRVHAASMGEQPGSDLNTVFRRLSYLLMPVDLCFVRGYFRHGNRIEKILFAFILPIKIYLGYAFYINSMVLKVKSKSFGA